MREREGLPVQRYDTSARVLTVQPADGQTCRVCPEPASVVVADVNGSYVQARCEEHGRPLVLVLQGRGHRVTPRPEASHGV